MRGGEVIGGRIVMRRIAGITLLVLIIFTSFAYAETPAQKAIQRITDKAKGIASEDITDTESEFIESEGRMSFLLYKTVQDMDSMAYTTQNHNPEISFDPSTQTLGFARFYITYFADCGKEEARSALESYTDCIIETLETEYPDVVMRSLMFCWKVPAVDEESLYAAVYWCEEQDGKLIRDGGSGLLYQ